MSKTGKYFFCIKMNVIVEDAYKFKAIVFMNSLKLHLSLNSRFYYTYCNSESCEGIF